MRRLAALLLVLAPASASAQPAADVVVAPNGDDANPGTAAAPLATPAKALAAARQLRGQGRAVTVLFRGGRYELAEPLTLTPDDSGTADAPLTLAAAPGESPVLRACYEPKALSRPSLPA